MPVTHSPGGWLKIGQLGRFCQTGLTHILPDQAQNLPIIQMV
jgi:hypothetical protein